MRLPRTDLNLIQNFQEKKNLKLGILNFVLGSNLSWDSPFSPLRRTLKIISYILAYFRILFQNSLRNYFLYFRIFFHFVLEQLKNDFLYLQIFFEIVKLSLRNPQFLTTLKNPKNYVFYVLNNNIWYTQLSFVFLFQIDFYICLKRFFVFFFSSSERFWNLSRASF